MMKLSPSLGVLLAVVFAWLKKNDPYPFPQM